MMPPIDEDKEVKTEQAVNDVTSTNKQTTVWWNNFDIFLNKDGKERARCKRCRLDYAIGTQSLNAHVKKCWPATHGLRNVRQKLTSDDMPLCSRKADQETFRENFAMAILRHGYPFKIVEHDDLRNVLSYLNSEVKLYTKDIARADCIKIYKREKELLRDVLASIPGRFSLTFDLWSSLVTDEYMCLTAHYVDNDWVLRSKILNFCHIPPPLDASILSEKIYELLKEWGIEKKVFSVTLDNARTCDGIQDILESRLQNGLLCKGEFFHVRCSTDILNLIVQDVMKIIRVILHKVRESVKYIKGLEDRKLRFAQCCEQFEVKQNYLRQDVFGRWDFAYLMLACALKFRHVFAHFATIEPDFDYCPTTEEWDRASKICRLIEPFHDITKLFTGTEYPTANLYFQTVWSIQTRLLEASKSEDVVVRDMAQQLLPKFQEYWDSCDFVLSLAVVLDPRLKMNFLKYCYTKVNTFTCHEKLTKVKAVMANLFHVYVSQSMVHDPRQTSNVTSFNIETLEFDNHEDFDNTKSELDQYLEEPRFSYKDHPQMDLLKFWKDNSNKYPILSMMARDIMSIPITTVASESAFSMGGKILTKLQGLLTPRDAQLRVCGLNWINGYSVEGDDGITEEELLVYLPMPSSEGVPTP